MLVKNLSGLDGLLIGVIGFGTIGRAVAQAFRNLGCRIGYFDPAADASAAEAIGASPMTFDDLLARADIVTLHVPLLPETRNLIGENELAKMKPGAVFIQASRGELSTRRRLPPASRLVAFTARLSMFTTPNRRDLTIHCLCSRVKPHNGCC
jgi:phosphoglycerate dehydrogenase-like enzyme